MNFADQGRQIVRPNCVLRDVSRNDVGRQFGQTSIIKFLYIASHKYLLMTISPDYARLKV
jgi:hypothetical protein